MIRLVDKDPVYLELYEALAYFRSRQQLVLRFITEQGVSVSDLRYGVRAWRGKTSQIGDWGEVWHFFFHGGGCTLSHKSTGEVIDFNGPDPECIIPYSFRTHLAWRLANDPGLSLLREFVASHGIEAVDDLVDHLVSDGILTPNYHLMPADHPEVIPPPR